MTSEPVGISGIYVLSAKIPHQESSFLTRVLLLNKVVPILSRVFSISPSQISYAVLATNITHPQSLLKTLAASFKANGNQSVSVSACVGPGSASSQALFDVLNRTETDLGLLLVMDEDLSRTDLMSSVICVLSSRQAVLTMTKPRVVYSIDGFPDPGSDRKTVFLAVFQKCVDLMMRNYPPTQSLLLADYYLFQAENRAEATDAFLSLLFMDMVANPGLYGSIGNISRALSLDDPSHCAMMENYSKEMREERLDPGLRLIDILPRSGNYALFSGLISLLISSDICGKRILLFSFGDQYQASLFLLSSAGCKGVSIFDAARFGFALGEMIQVLGSDFDTLKATVTITGKDQTASFLLAVQLVFAIMTFHTLKQPQPVFRRLLSHSKVKLTVVLIQVILYAGYISIPCASDCDWRSTVGIGVCIVLLVVVELYFAFGLYSGYIYGEVPVTGRSPVIPADGIGLDEMERMGAKVTLGIPYKSVADPPPPRVQFDIPVFDYTKN